MIRPATVSDIPAIAAMGKEFADEAGVTARVGWSDECIDELLNNLITNPDGILLVGDRCMIGGVVFGHPFSGKRVFQEMFWRSHGREGLRLLTAAEELARELGAECSVMIGMHDMPTVERLYARRGYAPAEQCYFKDF
jgi:hypothetical protein